ncbi:MAG TPA: hypothetical protein PL085_14570 [Agriterribacter sp.]|uniref:hypothetical protein n=1 Tax=Agriterribacter sp. TaxID=2821509 RepID=UPI002BD1E2BC|nr:hypothetical protein [Agriterribacter sp.]HRQ18296.1 hypothetical protein [Agriterribacter sp.]
MDFDSFPKHNLENEYLEHSVFEQLTELIDFYDGLSNTTMGFVSQGTKAITNLDTYVFTSISGTLESTKSTLFNGRLNDAYALLRKYYDSTIINIYTNLYLNDHFSIENFIVENIDNWLSGKQSIPEYRVISKYIKDSDKLKPITALLQKDELYKEIRNRCNDHTHYNFYHNILLNDNQIHFKGRINAINHFQNDLIAIFVQHLAYLFYLNDHYMMSSDYVDYLDLGMAPEEDSQYWVAPFIQNAFDKYVKTTRPDIADELKSKTFMQLQ